MDKIQQLIDEISGLEELSTFQNFSSCKTGPSEWRSQWQFCRGLTKLTQN
ncbi:hypothetical protein SLEP1_g26275 [Rubroshorea leprosula]|uniref:Uncharacterized protein n=1 Tax=Rubroshorea leprosula TaxID=152421 RepID=A0AAV5JLL4_9ROSI|nr:hypothetical protein SLEP1_g26275 [Rubroshorea leprosula]